MFWSDWGETPKIERASMDGDHSTRKIIIRKEISWPNGLTVDYENRKLYFADAKLGYIASSDFDGQNLKKIVKNVSQIFSLTLSENFLYWTDMQNANTLKHNIYKNGIHYYHRNLTGILGILYLNPDHNLSPLGITVYNSNRQPKSFNPCEKNNGNCSHLCLLSTNLAHYSCACPTGIQLEPDGKTCRSSAQKLLLLARRLDIRRISLDTNDYTPVVLPIKSIKHAVTLDFDPIDGKVYWTDDELRAIKRATLNGSSYEKVLSTELMYPDGLAIDWVARNIYWTDAGIDRIEVARLDGSFRKVLINKDIDQPRAIAVHPYEGLMFWTDWGAQAKIERAALDGSDRTIIINSSLTWPNGLAIDYELSHIYWCDAKTKMIEMSRFDGSNRKTIVEKEHSHMYGLTLIDNWIYWTDWTRRTVERAHKMTGNENTIIIENLPDLMGIKAISVAKPVGTNLCSENNGQCSHLCFNRPHQQYVCDCSDGSNLNEDGRTCSKAESFIYVLSKQDNALKISLKTKNIIQLPIPNMHSASSFDIDIAENRIYWIDSEIKMIASSYLNGSDSGYIIQVGLGVPRNLAFDWISKNLYWTDIEFNRIEVSRSNGWFRRVLFHDRNRQPYSLAVNPVDGYLFWSDWSNSGKIVASFLDGNRKKNIADSVGRAVSLTIDYNEKRLYWISQDQIMSSYFNGSVRSTFNPSKPSVLTIDNNFIYYLNQETKTLEYLDKNDQFKSNLFDTNALYSTINQMISSNQKGWNFCADQNGGCEHLCFVKPMQKHFHDTTINCSCASHYTLDSRDNKRCLRKLS